MRGENIINKKHGIFICLIGIDGSGKSTLAKQLAQDLSNNGLSFIYIYGRFVPILFKPVTLLAHAIVLGNSPQKSDYSTLRNRKQEMAKRYKSLSTLYYKFMLLDYYIQLFLKIKMPLMLGKNIVCDRYIYDTVVTDIAVDRGYSIDATVNLLKSCLLWFGDPDVVFLIDSPEEVAYRRKKDIVSLEYLIDRRKYYLSILRNFDIILINNYGDLNDVQTEILNKIKILLRGD